MSLSGGGGGMVLVENLMQGLTAIVEDLVRGMDGVSQIQSLVMQVDQMPLEHKERGMVENIVVTKTGLEGKSNGR